MDRTSECHAYHVAWYIEGDLVLPDVTVRVQSGRLLKPESGCASDAVELGSVAWIPGLVNAHTHLEFSLLAKPIPTTGKFTDWIRAVINQRRADSDPPRAIRAGLDESLRAGTTLIGDIAITGWAERDYSDAGFQGVVFQELLGLGDERVAAQSALARTIAGSQAKSMGFGLSPHAPYSVHPDLFENSIAAAIEFSCPIAMHLAETTAELELLANGTGEFRDLLTSLGIWREGVFGGKRPLDYLARLAQCPRGLVVHGNYLDDIELDFLAAHPQLTLVYCPRTHAAFGHAPHPWRRLIERGGSVALGTDSRASNPDLSLFAELQFLAARNPADSHIELLKLGTHSGRAALLGPDTNPGRADCCLVQWDTGVTPDPVRNLFAPRNRVVGTMLDGIWRYFPKSK